MARNDLKQAYLDMADITEVRFARKHFGSLASWYEFEAKHHEEVTMWRKELELQLKSMAYDVVIETAKGEGKEALQAAKFLLGKGVLTRDGTPEATEEEVKDMVKNPREQVNNDWLRLVKS